MGRPGLDRRHFLAAAGGLTVAGSFGFAALGTGADALASGADTRVRYWNLFSGGDGYNMIAMLDSFRRDNPGIDVKDSTLQWGSPFYTKLAMAAAGNRAPDLGVMHLGRVTGFSPGRLLDPWDPALLAEYGVREKDFNPELWKRAVIDGKLYALPLDIHVQLCFYRKDVLRKAGLLGGDGRLVPVTSTDEWFDVLKEAKKATGKGLQTLGLHVNDLNVQWWMFVAFYTQLGGTWFDAANTGVTFDTAKATEVLEFLRRHVTDGYSVAGAADAEQFVNGAPFTWEGNWSVPVFDTAKLDYGATPLPPVFGRRATHAESHAFVLPHQSDRSGATNDAAHRLAAYVVRHAQQWAGGGHIPAYTPTLSSAAYRKLQPQSEYVSAMDHQATEPKVWFAGSTGLLAQRLGPVVMSSSAGSAKPESAARRMKGVLTELLAMKNPMDGRTAAQGGAAA
ncbi:MULTISPECIES: extracellular solute-binding protein [Streptomyces]|uniref:extracellular solute-binding protein n=1 Tax=Streptomyces TaxID=1883 RepID=UPI0004BD4930|nr:MULTISPECIES: extracellular solute-binding protein [Streptomyces]NEB63415.1 extracellular solute-binding protein [Streptomyces diastaticus]KOT93549.1 sugar transporter [Streptomyces sp. NRRL F-4711]KOX28413.1 sugar transporter [Streptomyces sp. NRRL F-4707]KOX53355.1 sugar transporter [Streptomyces sp. NRRL F-7442]MCL7365768.1 extracellular solute-binding protein [Streptomyces ardesiacus]